MKSKGADQAAWVLGFMTAHILVIKVIYTAEREREIVRELERGCKTYEITLECAV